MQYERFTQNLPALKPRGRRHRPASCPALANYHRLNVRSASRQACHSTWVAKRFSCWIIRLKLMTQKAYLCVRGIRQCATQASSRRQCTSAKRCTVVPQCALTVDGALCDFNKQTPHSATSMIAITCTWSTWNEQHPVTRLMSTADGKDLFTFVRVFRTCRRGTDLSRKQLFLSLSEASWSAQQHLPTWNAWFGEHRRPRLSFQHKERRVKIKRTPNARALLQREWSVPEQNVHSFVVDSFHCGAFSSCAKR